MTVSVDDIDTYRVTCKSLNNGTERVGGPALASDHSSEVLGMNVDAQHLATSVVAKINLHVLWVINDPPDQVFQRFLQHGHYSAASSVFSSAAVSAAASGVRAASGVGSGASGTTTEPFSGTTKASFSAGCCMTDSSYSSPLVFCQSPVSFSRAVTC